MSTPMQLFRVRQAITTKFLCPTNTRGARVKAVAEAGSVIVPWDYEIDAAANAFNACEQLAAKLGWVGQWVGGGTGNGFVFVCVSECNVVTVRKEYVDYLKGQS